MKLGAENPKKVIVTVGLMVIALALFVYMVSGSNAPQAVMSNGPQAGRKPIDKVLDPTLRTGLLRASEAPVYAGTGRNIFVSQNDPPPAPKCAPLGGPSHGLPFCGEVIVPSPPKPAAIPLSFFGFACKAGEPKKVFLSHDQDLFVAQEGDIVDRRYKIVHINPGSVEVQDLLDQEAQPQEIGLKT